MQLLITARQVLNSLKVLSDNEKEGHTLTVLKVNLLEVSKNATSALSGVNVLLPLGQQDNTEWLAFNACTCADIVNKNRKREDWLKGLQANIEALQDYINLQAENNQAATELLEQTDYLEGPELDSPVTRLQEIEQEIPALLTTASNAYLQVGQLLSEAREEFDNQVLFLEWALSKFNIRKSQAFRLMKIAKEFAGDTRFDGVAMRVLDALSGESDEVKEKAAALAATGQLNTPALQVIQGGKPEAEPEPLPDVPQDAKPLNVPPVQTDKPAPLEATDEASEEVKTLRLTIQNLVAQQDLLLQKLAELQRPRAQQLPMLPHFKASSLHTRLGLATTASAKEVRAAYRAITAHYTPETNKEAFELLTAARDALLQEVAA